MESALTSTGFPSGNQSPAEERMLREDVVKEILSARRLGSSRNAIGECAGRWGWTRQMLTNRESTSEEVIRSWFPSKSERSGCWPCA